MTTELHSSDLFPEIHIEPVAPKKRVTRKSTAVASPQATVLAPVVDAEAMACALESHPDYRVSRRLKPRMHWAEATGNPVLRIVVLDTETTGLDHTKDKIIEMALLRLEVDSVTGLPVGNVQVYDGLEDPGIPIPPEVVAITGLTDNDVQGHHLDENRIAQLLEGVDLVIAHNAGFDRPFCEARLASFARLNWACSFADIDWKAQGRSSAKLENLAQALGLFYDAHRAEMDCHALVAVLVAKLPAAVGTGLAHLIETAKWPTYRLQATQAPFDAKDKLKARAYRWNAEQKVWHTRLGDDQSLQLECDWLKAHVYGQRSAVVQVEKLDPTVKYSARAGEIMYRQL